MITTPEHRVALHEMPDLSKVAPEVTYGQPRRGWIRYLAAGLAVAAVGAGAGLVISSATTTETAPVAVSEYALVREHLAQTPGGFPLVTASGQVVENSLKLQMEHLAQAGFPASTLQMFGGQPYVRPDSPSALTYPNEGPVTDAPGALAYPNQGPAADAPNVLAYPNEGPVTDAPGALAYPNQGPANDSPNG